MLERLQNEGRSEPAPEVARESFGLEFRVSDVQHELREQHKAKRAQAGNAFLEGNIDVVRALLSGLYKFNQPSRHCAFEDPKLRL